MSTFAKFAGTTKLVQATSVAGDKLILTNWRNSWLKKKPPQKCAIPYGHGPKLRLKLWLPVSWRGHPPYPIQARRSPHKVCAQQDGLRDTRRRFSAQLTMDGKADLVLGIVF